MLAASRRAAVSAPLAASRRALGGAVPTKKGDQASQNEMGPGSGGEHTSHFPWHHHESVFGHSKSGYWSTYTMRQRVGAMKRPLEPAQADYFFAKAVNSYAVDPGIYAYMWVSFFACGLSGAYLVRQMMLNPDVTYRKSARVLHPPDKERQHMYALPYINHRWRNWITKYPWMVCDNEYDSTSISATGTRPDRVMCHRNPYIWSVFRWINYRYPMQDPYMTTLSHANMKRIYHDMGYKVQEDWEEEEEED